MPLVKNRRKITPPLRSPSAVRSRAVEDRHGIRGAAMKAKPRLRIGAVALAGAVLCMAWLGAARAEEEFPGVDPLRQMGSSSANPLIYLFLDTSKTLSNPLEINDDQGNEPWFINNTGGWRYIEDRASFIDADGNELCSAFSDTVEFGDMGWTLSSIDPMYPNLWHIVREPTCSPSSASGGEYSWYFGCSPDNPNNPANCVPCTFEVADPVADCPDPGCVSLDTRGNLCDRKHDATLCRRRVAGAIESPPIDTLGATIIDILFMSRAVTESNPKYDKKLVEVRVQDSATGVWSNWHFAGQVLDTSGIWVPQSFNLDSICADCADIDPGLDGILGTADDISNCTNGRDDDGDTFIDESDCTNGIDDDGDGLTDEPLITPGDTIQIRFRFDSMDYIHNFGLGWMVDDIRMLYSDLQCAGYAWYEPSRISTVKNVLGDSVNIATLRDLGGCNFGTNLEGPDGETPYSLALDADRNLSCDERTVDPFLAPRLEDSGDIFTAEASVFGAAGVYGTQVCAGDMHPSPHATKTHATWNASPCAYFTENPPNIDPDLQTSACGETDCTDGIDNNGDGIIDDDDGHTIACSLVNPTDPKNKEKAGSGALSHNTACADDLISSLVFSMNFGLMIGASNVGKAIDGGDPNYNTDLYDAVGNPIGYTTVGGIAHLVPVNTNDEDFTGQRYNTDRINAYLRKWGVTTTLDKPDGTGSVDIGGLGVTDQPTFPIQNSDAAGQTLVDIVTALSDENDPNYDPRARCRNGYVIMLIDSFFTSGSLASCQGQMTAAEGRLATLATGNNVRTFVIQFGPESRRYNANRLAYFGWTDASAGPDNPGGLEQDDAGLPVDLKLATFDDSGYTNDSGCAKAGCDCSNTADEIYDYAYFATNRKELKEAFKAIFEAIAQGDLVTAPPTVTPTISATGDDQYVGLLTSAEFPGWRGHLRAFDLRPDEPEELWDAGGDNGTAPPYQDPTTYPAHGFTSRDLSADPRAIWSSEFNSTSPAHKLFPINDANWSSLAKSFNDMAAKGLVSFPKDGFTAVAGEETTDDCSKINIYELIDFIKGFDGRVNSAVGHLQRPWILGDVVNVSPVLVQRPLDFLMGTAANKEAFDDKYENRHPIIYAPANDGLLHAFDSVDGYEVWAYLPPTQIDNAARLYCSFKDAYDASLEVCLDNENDPPPPCVLDGDCCSNGVDDDGDGAIDEECGDYLTCTQDALDKMENPTGQNTFLTDHIYGLAAAPRVGEIRVKMDPACDDTLTPNCPSGDPLFCCRSWATALFMGEGAGGSNYYALDVTHPYGPGGRTVTDHLKGQDFTADEDECFGYPDSCSNTSPPLSIPLHGNPTNSPFQVLWRIGPDKPGFEGLGESWSTVPVGLINDPTINSTADPPPKLQTFAVALGSYHRPPEFGVCVESDCTDGIDNDGDGSTDEWESRCGQVPCAAGDLETLNTYWIVRAEDGALLKRSDDFKDPALLPATDGDRPYHQSAADFLPDGTKASYDSVGESVDNDDERKKPKIPNSTLPDVIMMETDFAGLPAAFYPDGIVTHLFQADLHGRIWAADISDEGTDWGIGTWAENWKQWKLFDPLNAPPDDIGSPGDVPVSTTPGATKGLWTDTDGLDPANMTAIGAQPIHYTPAIGHLSANRYVVAFSTGGWGETHSNVAGEQFAPHLVLLVTDENLVDPALTKGSTSHGICQAWVVRLDNIAIVGEVLICGEADCDNGLDDDGDGLIDELDPAPTITGTLSPSARVTGSPLLVIQREASLGGAGRTSGTAIFSVYDPIEIPDTGPCVGTSFAIVVDFQHVNNFENCNDPTGATVAQAIEIGIGFQTLTAGPTSPIMAVSSTKFGDAAKLKKVKGMKWPGAGPEITVLSWQELSCDY
ncbi:MAG: hypothetical protein JSV08_09965 [Acidobacteriota bacterium]|nr:MAG: hypothetical protein JSV08_09965 [Acidobacteriota bacterium]